MKSFEEKCIKLHALMQEYTKQNTAVAFSGGVDSSLLLKLAALHAEKQGSRVYAITADTSLHPGGDIGIASKVAKETGVLHKVLRIEELERAGITENPLNRCYLCKKYIFTEIRKMADSIHAPVVLEGTNADDSFVYRPGIRAVEELEIKSPLREAGFTKENVRRLAKEYGISVADRPSAPCLATRFPYGTHLEEEEMKKVEQGEMFLRDRGFYNVRIRVYGELVRIEVDISYISRLLECREEIVDYLKMLGYQYVTLDMEGFRSGSMDI